MREQLKRRCDFLVLAFRTDRTRVRAVKLNHDHGHARFPRRSVAVGHHELSHPDRGDQSPEWLKVNSFFLEQLAKIARKLDTIREGGNGPCWTTLS